MEHDRRQLAAEAYFGSALRSTPLIIGEDDAGEVCVWRHAGYNDVGALSVRPGQSTGCMVFDGPEDIRDLANILLGLADAIDAEESQTETTVAVARMAHDG